jgi:hypothetical protein
LEATVKIMRHGDPTGQIEVTEQSCSLQPGQGATLLRRERGERAHLSFLAFRTMRHSTMVLGESSA